MQSLTALMGGGGRFSHFVQLTGSGVWTVPPGVQMVRALMAAGGSGGTSVCVSGASPCQSGGSSAYAEVDYPVLGQASIPFSVGAGSAGVQTSVYTGTLSSCSSVVNPYLSSYNDWTLTVPSALISGLPAGTPVMLKTTAGAGNGTATMTFASTPGFGIAVGWTVYVEGDSATRVIQSIAGGVVTLTTNIAGTVSAGVNRVFFAPPTTLSSAQQFGIYIASLPYVAIGSASYLSNYNGALIASSTTLLVFRVVNTQATPANGAALVLSTVPLFPVCGGNTTFGNLIVYGGTPAASSKALGTPNGSFTLPQLSSTSYEALLGGFVFIPGVDGTYSGAGAACGVPIGSLVGAGAGGVSANPVAGNGGPGAGGGAPAATNVSSPAPCGGNGGSGLLYLLY